MITKIIMNQVASYKKSTALETDKKVNLIYGLNGTGKSTLSDFLYDRINSRYVNCSIEGLNNEEILVYNQRFIKDYFYESDNIKGIFTLSKANKEAEEAIRKAEGEIDRLEKEKRDRSELINKHNYDFNEKKQRSENKIWEIKTTYSGGDRVLEYCLSGLMGKKGALFNYLLSISKPAQKPSKTVEQLKKDVEAIQGSTAQKYDLLPLFNFSAHNIESNQLFKKEIIGNENSAVAGLIKTLGNSDWVKKGLEYLPNEVIEKEETCPFCQEKTITRTLIRNIQNYF